MAEVKETVDSALLTKLVVAGMQEKKAHDIVIMDLDMVDNAVCNYFVVCHGTSHPQVQAIADSVEEIVLKEMKDKPWHKEGHSNAEWILLDYVDVVVHIFLEDKREFYQIEDLWADARIERIEDEY